MKIITLAENISSLKGIGAEHGLSLYIETDKHNILFDMGQTELFYHNAQKLGVDLKNVDFAVLSHGHYDHGGGLSLFLEINKTAKVYMHKSAFEPHYNGTEKYIGLDKQLISSDRIIFTDNTYKIVDGIELYACNDKERHFDHSSHGLNTFIGDRFVQDNFIHEQYLLIEENGKRVLFSGCSHKGILNIAEWFAPDVLVGGFHFSKTPLDEKLSASAKALNEYDTYYYTCHCTGKEQYDHMSRYIKRLSYLSCGQSIII